MKDRIAFAAESARRFGRSLRSYLVHRFRRARRSRLPRRARRVRTFWGEEPRLEILNKLVTISALAFGAWAYFNSVQPVFEKEHELQLQRQRAGERQRLVDQLNSEKSRLQQHLERVQSFTARHRKGIVLSHLAEIRRTIEKDALTYQGLAPVGFNLRNYSLAWAAAQLKRLDQPQAGSAGAYEREALEFFQGFVDGSVPPGTDDVGWLAPLLDAYDRESGAAVGGAATP